MASPEDTSMTTPEEETPTKEQPTSKKEEPDPGFSLSEVLFRSMVTHPWPYLLTLPIVFLLLICFGWIVPDDIVEDEVTNIWIPTSGSYANDVKYAKDFGKDDLDASSFAAMSIARDGKNLFTESRLEEIRARMEKTESTTVSKIGSKVGRSLPFIRNTRYLILSNLYFSCPKNRLSSRARPTTGKTFALAMAGFPTNSLAPACLTWMSFKRPTGS